MGEMDTLSLNVFHRPPHHEHGFIFKSLGRGGAMKVSQVHNSIPSAAGGTQEGRLVMGGGE